MLGAIIGDILGSIHEKIPKLELRKEIQMTDDSFLTLACISWMQNIDYTKLKFLFEKNLQHPDKDLERFSNDLRLKGEKCLIKWHHIGTNSNINKKLKENLIPIFSPGFDNWVLSKKDKIKTNVKHKGNTNGCLMRNSPISYFGVKNGLTLNQIIFLTELFCSLTHSHIDSLKATKQHSTLLFLIQKNYINTNNIKTFFENPSSLYTGDIDFYFNLQPLFFWTPTIEKIENDPKCKFIWDAKTSLDIALSSIYYSKSYQETIDFCNATQMDTDTYCAIAGPIAESLWGIDSNNLEIGTSCIKKEKDATNLLLKAKII